MRTDSDPGFMNLNSIIVILKQYSMFITLTSIAVLIISIAANYFLIKPQYEAKAVLLVTRSVSEKDSSDKNRTDSEGIKGLMNTMSVLPPMSTDSYIGQIQSEAVIKRVIKRLELGTGDYTVNNLAKKISVSKVPNTNLIEVKVTDGNPLVACKIANTMVEELPNFISDINQQKMKKTLKFLQDQTAMVGNQVVEARTELNYLEGQSKNMPALQQAIALKNNEILSQSQILKLKEQTKSNDGGLGQDTIEQSKTQLGQLQLELSKKRTDLELANKRIDGLVNTYTLLETKLQETQISTSVKFGDASMEIVSRANEPSIVKINKIANVTLAFVTGLLIPVILAILRTYFQFVVKSGEMENSVRLEEIGQLEKSGG